MDFKTPFISFIATSVSMLGISNAHKRQPRFSFIKRIRQPTTGRREQTPSTSMVIPKGQCRSSVCKSNMRQLLRFLVKKWCSVT